jgi:hypothetical protein
MDPARLRGEGGPLDPCLVVPIKVRMHPQPAEHQLALVWLSGRLMLGPDTSGEQLGSTVGMNLMNQGFPCRSVPGAPNENGVELRFHLAPAQVSKLEEARHAASPGRFILRVALDGVTAWMRHTGNSMQGVDGTSTLGEDGWPTTMGMFTDLSYFWYTKIGPLRVQVEPSSWVDKVLPGWGLDHVRLVEMSLPPALPEHGDVARQFSRALRDLDLGRYDDSIAACRGVKNAWEKELGANKKHPVAQILAEKQGWPENDPRRKLLDQAWQGLWFVVNPPHHPEWEQDFRPSHADARFCLLLTAILSEYLDSLRRGSGA